MHHCEYVIRLFVTKHTAVARCQSKPPFAAVSGLAWCGVVGRSAVAPWPVTGRVPGARWSVRSRHLPRHRATRLSIPPGRRPSPINSQTATRREQYYEPTTVWTSSTVTHSRFSGRVDMPPGNSKLCLNPIKYTKLSPEPWWRFTAIRRGHLTAMVQIFIVGWRNIVTLERLRVESGV